MEKVEITDKICIGLYALCGINFVCNLIGLIIMFKVEKKIRFEKCVLISGIFEISLILLYIIKIHKEIIQDIIQLLQITITLYISKYFLKLYICLEHTYIKKNNLSQKYNQSESHIYNTYFWLLAVINIIFVIAIFLIEIIVDKKNNILDGFFDFINDTVCMAISIILFIFSFMVRKIMIKKSNEINNQDQTDDDSENRISLRNEKYLSTRKIQILIISLSNLITDFFEFILSIFKELIYRNEIEENTLYLIDVLILYSLWLSTFTNFIAFFFVVRDSFHIEYTHIKRKNDQSILTKSLIDKNRENKNNDIDIFICEEGDDNNKKSNLDETTEFN